jgi:predicted nucleotidyltransferase component of viral defense system
MITEAYLRRHVAHYRGSGDALIVGLLDVVQTYILEALRQEGYFDRGLVFKGGTALRKFYLGSVGRFSTDMDFTFAPDSSYLEDALLWLAEGSEIFDVRFRFNLIDDRRGRLDADTPLGKVEISSMVEFSPRGAWLNPPLLKPETFAFYPGLEFTPAPLPVLDIHEILAEKLAAIWRRKHARDLYDLGALGKRPLNEPLLRRLTYLKIYFDVVEGISKGPFKADELLDVLLGVVDGWSDLGLLSIPPKQTDLIQQVRTRYGFLRICDETEINLAKTSLSDKEFAEKCIGDLRSSSDA